MTCMRYGGARGVTSDRYRTRFFRGSSDDGRAKRHASRAQNSALNVSRRRRGSRPWLGRPDSASSDTAGLAETVWTLGPTLGGLIVPRRTVADGLPGGFVPRIRRDRDRDPKHVGCALAKRLLQM